MLDSLSPTLLQLTLLAPLVFLLVPGAESPEAV